MSETKPLYIADSCVGGLSVLKSIWDSGADQDVVFLADYAVNPLGVKGDEQIRDVVFQWLSRAAAVSDTLVIGCNTLSIRYEQLRQVTPFAVGPAKVISMVDCFKSMLEKERDRLSHKRVLIIGTKFTASQSVYPNLLREHCAGVEASAIAATELERSIARMELFNAEDDSVITPPLRSALAQTDFAILACTCFPMARSKLEAQFPDVIFLDPGLFCPPLLTRTDGSQQRQLDLQVTGDVLSKTQVLAFAEDYLQTS